LNEELVYFKKIQEAVNKYPENPTLEIDESWLYKNEEGKHKIRRPKSFTFQIIKCTGGYESAQAAFVYLVTGKKEYLEKAKKMLKLSVEAYEWSWKHQLPVEWVNNHCVASLLAYDWLYNDMTIKERTEIIVPLMNIIRELQTDGKASFHRCIGGVNSGFYGVRALLWYAGIAAYKNGICDKEAESFLKEGYKFNVEMLNHRDRVSSGDGILAAATLAYSFGEYPFASYNFYHTFYALTGVDISNKWEHMANYPQWVYWNWINNGDKNPLEFGIGDCGHTKNFIPVHGLYTHLSQNIHFYKNSNPSCAKLAEKVIENLPDYSRHYSRHYPMTPFLLTNFGKVSDCASSELSDKKAKYFKSFGMAFMRSGDGADDTYCLFRAGSQHGKHQHYDENSFIIYHKGFLALDSGTTGITMSYELPYYFAQTVAHNSILIHMPDEPISHHWGPKTTIGPYKGSTPFCHGGQCSKTGGKCLGFETNELFTYVAGDATKCYSSKKCSQAVRQFVFLYPDVFVVFDRVSSVSPDYRKEWLLHSENEPEIKGDVFSLSEGDGVLFCKALYPADSDIRKIGGPGKEFWASGKNWELHSMEKKKYSKKKTLFGKWRIEVSPGKSSRDDFFLHFIQVGDKGKLKKMIDSRLISDEKKIGVSFEYKGKSFNISFNRGGKVGGRIVANDSAGESKTYLLDKKE
jgi:heparin/heparan-sulfate lyase